MKRHHDHINSYKGKHLIMGGGSHSFRDYHHIREPGGMQTDTFPTSDFQFFVGK